MEMYHLGCNSLRSRLHPRISPRSGSDMPTHGGVLEVVRPYLLRSVPMLQHSCYESVSWSSVHVLRILHGRIVCLAHLACSNVKEGENRPLRHSRVGALVGVFTPHIQALANYDQSDRCWYRKVNRTLRACR
jgi:hypothetical protein